MNDRQILNAKHRDNPEPGDYWEDHLVGVCVVLGVSPFAISICQTKKAMADGWTWDLSKIENKTPPEFRKWLNYDSIPGTWASVWPRHHKAFADEALEILNQKG